MPTARQPLIRAIWPTAEPTAPAAEDTSTVSPGCGRPTSSSAKYAVIPGMPRMPSAVEIGASAGSTGRSAAASATAYSCQPSMPSTMSPAARSGLSLRTTWPTTPPTITSPISTGLA
jgi:hypothetical protein